MGLVSWEVSLGWRWAVLAPPSQELAASRWVLPSFWSTLVVTPARSILTMCLRAYYLLGAARCRAAGRRRKQRPEPRCALPMVTESDIQGFTLQSFQLVRGRGFPPTSLRPRTWTCVEGSSTRRSHVQWVPTACPACPQCLGLLHSPFSPAGWSRAITRWQMPPGLCQGDVMPGGGGGPLRSPGLLVLAPKPRPGAPSQLEAGRHCISAGEEEGPAWLQAVGMGDGGAHEGLSSGLCDPHPRQETPVTSEPAPAWVQRLLRWPATSTPPLPAS